MSTITEKIHGRLAKISNDVEEAVLAAVAKREIEKRSSAIVRCFDLLMREEKEYKKINRPDVVHYDGDGKVSHESYSKERVEARKKSQQMQEKLNKAIDKAMSSEDFSDVYNLAGAAGKE